MHLKSVRDIIMYIDRFLYIEFVYALRNVRTRTSAALCPVSVLYSAVHSVITQFVGLNSTYTALIKMGNPHELTDSIYKIPTIFDSLAQFHLNVA